jgi:hypothetical protein
MIAKRTLIASLAALATAVALPASGAATLVIENFNLPGVGFNDPTPATPVGGNTGTTLGQQRLNAFAFAASKWSEQLDSSVPIVIRASMEPRDCTATSAVLGSAGPTFVELGFPGAISPDHLYHVALANKLANADLEPGLPHIRARFNSNLGNPGCLTGSPFYLGLDNNAGPLIDLVSVLLHEFGHGLGFSTTTNGQTGAMLAGFPSIYDAYTYDNARAKTWDAMTNAERAASAVSGANVAWNGSLVTSAAPSVLYGTPQLLVLAPTEVAGSYAVGTASFGAVLEAPGLTGQVMQVVDQANGTGIACTPLDANNARAVKNKIALVDRGTCAFVIKAKNVQNAGAVGMIVADNAPGAPAGMSGADPTVVIPSIRVSQAAGVALKAAINGTPSGRSSGLVGRLGLDRNRLAGTDAAGRVLLYTPTAFSGGSSVSHWDTSAFRNLLMEPFINADLPHGLAPPLDLTVPMLKDIGW